MLRFKVRPHSRRGSGRCSCAAGRARSRGAPPAPGSGHGPHRGAWPVQSRPGVVPASTVAMRLLQFCSKGAWLAFQGFQRKQPAALRVRAGVPAPAAL